MKSIAIIGAGAIGSLVGGLLTKQGRDVLLVGRADHVESIRRNGLRIRGFNGDETIKVRVATALDKEYDLVIFTTKTMDLEAAYQASHKFMDIGNGCILSTQNGVQADTLLSFHFEPKDMYSSIVMFGATYEKPGEVVYNFPGDWILGKPFGMIDARLEDIEGLLKPAFSVVISKNIMGMKWLKLFVNFNNCIPALTGKSMQETFADMDMCRLSVLLLKEGVAMVKSAGIEMASLPSFPVERILGMAEMPTDQAAGILSKTLTGLSREPLYGSILQSIMRGRTSEIDFINGEVVQIARAHLLEVPLNRKIVDMVHQVEETGKFFSLDEIKKQFNLGKG